MSALLVQPKSFTLDYLVLHYGPVELQRPLSKDEFVNLAEHFPVMLLPEVRSLVKG